MLAFLATARPEVAEGWLVMLRVLFEFCCGRVIKPTWCRHFPTPAPLQKTRTNGAPTVLVMPATSKSWATRHKDSGCLKVASAPLKYVSTIRSQR